MSVYTVKFGQLGYSVSAADMRVACIIAGALAAKGWPFVQVVGPDGETVPWRQYA